MDSWVMKADPASELVKDEKQKLLYVFRLWRLSAASSSGFLKSLLKGNERSQMHQESR